MSSWKLGRNYLSLLMLFWASTLNAATVVNSLPFQGTPDWTDSVSSGATIVLNGAGTESLLTTANNGGSWFGWGPAAQGYGTEPSWSLGSNSDGNYIRLEASFSANAADWSMYMHDLEHSMGFTFAPTDCNGNIFNCYGTDGAAGVRLSHPGGGTFIDLDLTQQHTYEVLLKDSLVAYWIDGIQHYAGPAGDANLGFPLLVIGDGSGTTLTGRGSMTVFAAELDNAPLANVVVPLPASLPLLVAALGLLGTRLRKMR